MRLIYITVYVVAAAVKQERTCDLKTLPMPENADSWSCDKPILEGKVEKYTRCKIVCSDGYDFSKGKRRDFHRCKRTGEWQRPENVVLFCKPNGEFFKAKLLTALQTHITDIEYLSQTCQEDTDRLTEELKQCSSNNELLQPTGNIGLSIIRHVENARETDVCVGTSTSLGYIMSNSCCQADEMFLFDLENSAEIKIEANSIWIEDHICFINTTETINVDVPIAETEVWNFETGQMKTIEPTLPNDEYVDGIALYFVDAGFCDKPNDY